MSRHEFLQRLQRGLRGVPAETTAAIMLDYDGYFDDGARAGRGEAELALALGDPDRLAAELRLQVNARQWETDRSVQAGLRTAWGALGLALFDAVLVVPLAVAGILCIAGILAAVLIVLVGCYVLVVTPFDEPDGGPVAAVLQGVGLIAGGVAGTAALALASTWLVNALSWYGRVHRRIVGPPRPPTLRSGGCS